MLLVSREHPPTLISQHTHTHHYHTQGATDAVLDTLPEVIVDASHIRVGQDNTCPICLSEMAIGESARVLGCSHIFHKQVRGALNCAVFVDDYFSWCGKRSDAVHMPIVCVVFRNSTLTYLKCTTNVLFML